MGVPHGRHAQEDPRGLHPATRPSTPGSQPRHPRDSHCRATCRETGPRGSDRWPLEKDPPQGGHLASGLPVCKSSGQGPRRQTRHDTPLPGPPEAARTIAALLALRGQVIAPSWPTSAALALAASPRTGPASTATTRHSAPACRPVPRPGHQRRPRCGIDNILSIGEMQVPSRPRGRAHPPPTSGTPL